MTTANIRNSIVRSFVCTTLAFIGIVSFPSQKMALAKTSEVNVSYAVNASLNGIAVKGKETTLAYFTFESLGSRTTIDRMLLRNIGNAPDIAFEKIWLVDGNNNPLTNTAKVNGGMVSFTNILTLEYGEKKKVGVRVLLRDNINVGNTMGFEVTSKNSLEMSSDSGDTIEIIGEFPFTPEKLIALGNAKTDQYLSAEYITSPATGAVFPGGKDIDHGIFRFLFYGEGSAEISRIAFGHIGSLHYDFLKNIRLEDAQGEAFGSWPSLDSVSFTMETPFSVSYSAPKELSLISDLDLGAPDGKFVSFEISSLQDVLARSMENSKIIEAQGSYPLKTTSRIIGNKSLNIEISESSPVARLVEKGEEDIIFGAFEITSGSLSTTISNIEFQKKGTLTGEFIEALRITDEDGDTLFGPAQVSDGKALFSGNLKISPGETKKILLIGSITPEAESGKTLGFSLTETASIKCKDSGGGTISPSGVFPISTAIMTVSEKAENGSLNISFPSSGGTPRSQYGRFKYNPLLAFDMEAIGGEIEMNSMIFQIGGTMDPLLFEYFYILDGRNTIVAKGALEGKKINITTPFPIKNDGSQTYTLVGRMKGAPSENQTIIISIPDKDSIQPIQMIGGKSAPVTGKFPYTAPSLTILPVPSSASLFTSFSFRVSPFPVPQGRKGMWFGEIQLSAINGDIQLSKIMLKKIAESGFSISHIVLWNTELGEISGEENSQSGMVSFEKAITIPDGQTIKFAIKADMSPGAQIGKTAKFALASSSYITASASKGSEMEHLSPFPMETSSILVGPSATACPEEKKPVCGRKYDGCESPPCKDPVDKTYENECLMEKDHAYLVFGGACESIPHPTDPIPSDPGPIENPEKAELPEASYMDPPIIDFTPYIIPFPDTDVSLLRGKAAVELFRRKVINGFPDGYFYGDRTVNRAEAAKFLILTKFGEIEENPTGAISFSDVPGGEWFEKYVLTAATRGIINGYPDGTFKPAEGVNTAEFLKMATLTFGLEENLSYSFTDVSPDDWFARYAGAAEKYKLFPRRTENLQPADPLSRYEVALVIYQYLRNR